MQCFRCRGTGDPSEADRASGDFRVWAIELPADLEERLIEEARERADTMSVPGATRSGLVRPSAAGPREENAAMPCGPPPGLEEIRSVEMGAAP